MSIPLVMTMMSIATTAVGFLTAKGSADAQEEANELANERDRKYMIEDYDQMTRMGQQESANASQRLQKNEIDARRAAATAEAGASAGGVDGLSVDALLTDLYGQEAGIRDSVNQNVENTGHQLNMERKGIRRTNINRQASRPVVNQPSLIGAVAGGVTGAYGAYADGLKIRKQLKGG